MVNEKKPTRSRWREARGREESERREWSGMCVSGSLHGILNLLVGTMWRRWQTQAE
jgi:hypothetical protein